MTSNPCGCGNKLKIPTFSQSGPEEVKQGVLLSISYAGFKYVSQFYVETFARIMNGANPRELPQLFEDPPKIAINLKTARTIEWDKIGKGNARFY